MRHDDICIVTRTTTAPDPVTHIATKQTITYPSTGGYSCRLGKATGNLVQMQPQGTLTQILKLYIPDVTANIKTGDIVILNNTTKYIVGNVYKPNNHHIEANVTYKEEV